MDEEEVNAPDGDDEPDQPYVAPDDDPDPEPKSPQSDEPTPKNDEVPTDG